MSFFSDCVHEVKPVTKGTRVTVTYLIDTTNDKGKYNYSQKKKPSKKFFCGPVDATMNLSKVHELLGHLNGMSRRETKGGGGGGGGRGGRGGRGKTGGEN